MNVEQLKKQAKHLRNAYPDLVATHGDRMTLAQAQSVIAHLNGYPSWELLVHKNTAPTVEPGPSPAPFGDLIRKWLVFSIDEEPTDVPVDYSEHTGMPTRYRSAHVAILRHVREKDGVLTREEDDRLYERMDQMFGNASEYDFRMLSRPVLDDFEGVLRESLMRAPLNVDGHNLLSGLLYSQRRYEEADQVSAPVLEALMALLPSDRQVQVEYGFMENRPFFRLLHCRVLILDKLGRHRDANALAKLGLKYCPNDNLGLRFLRSKALRAEGEE